MSTTKMGGKLFVGSLSWNVDDAALRAAFAAHGEVTDAAVVRDRDTGRSRGFGFVTMADATQAEAARQALDGSALDGRRIRVSVAEERSRGPSRRDGGGRGGPAGGHGGRQGRPSGGPDRDRGRSGGEQRQRSARPPRGGGSAAGREPGGGGPSYGGQPPGGEGDGWQSDRQERRRRWDDRKARRGPKHKRPGRRSFDDDWDDWSD